MVLRTKAGNIVISQHNRMDYIIIRQFSVVNAGSCLLPLRHHSFHILYNLFAV